LTQLFAPFGVVRDAVVLRHPNGLSKLCGFVHFTTAEEANNAMLALSSRVYLSGSTRPLTVSFAGEKAAPTEYKLFVGRIPMQMNEAAITQMFSPYGNVTDVFLMRDAAGSSKGSAFVKFSQRDHAEAAILNLNGAQLFSGYLPLSVSYAVSGKSASGKNRD